MLKSERSIFPALRSIDKIKNKEIFSTRARNDPFFNLNRGHKRISLAMPSSKSYKHLKSVKRISSVKSRKAECQAKKYRYELKKDTPKIKLISGVISEAKSLKKRPFEKIKETLPLQYGGGTFRRID